MATHSSILAWRIPWIEEPGRLTEGQILLQHHGLATRLTETRANGIRTGLAFPVPHLLPLLLLSLKTINCCKVCIT